MVIPRTAGQGNAVRARAEPSLRVPEGTIDAQSLIAYADLVVSAGGTMNREAVALGHLCVHDLRVQDGGRRRGR